MANERAQTMLVEAGVFTNKSFAREKLLGCLGCQFASEGVAYGRRIERCGRLNSGTSTPILHKLAAAGALHVERETGNPSELGRPLKKLYSPTDETELGRKFAQALEAPAVCGLPPEIAPAPQPFDPRISARAILAEINAAAQNNDHTITKIAETTGLTRQSIYNLRDGEENPNLLSLLAYADAVGLRIAVVPKE